MAEQKINFRKLTLNDLPLLQNWLNTEFVSRWYGKGNYSTEEIQQKYGKRITGEAPTDCYFIRQVETPIGYIQSYRTIDYPNDHALVEGDEGTTGVDMFLSEAKHAGRGLGSAALTLFVQKIFSSAPTCTNIVMGPHPDNVAAIRAYEKVGFHYFKEIVQPDGEREYLMKLKKQR